MPVSSCILRVVQWFDEGERKTSTSKLDIRWSPLYANIEVATLRPRWNVFSWTEHWFILRQRCIGCIEPYASTQSGVAKWKHWPWRLQEQIGHPWFCKHWLRRSNGIKLFILFFTPLTDAALAARLAWALKNMGRKVRQSQLNSKSTQTHFSECQYLRCLARFATLLSSSFWYFKGLPIKVSCLKQN